MKINLNNAIIEKLSTMADHSIQLKISLPELSPEAMTNIFQVLNKEVVEIEFDADVEEKSPSKRLRAVLYIFWEQQYKGAYPEFEVFYRSKMEDIINRIKDKLSC